jgi:predicted acyl esterase
MVSRCTAVLLAGLFIVSRTHSGTEAQDASVVTTFGVPMKTRDGVTLRADIYRPTGDGKFPVPLQRTPYDKNGERSFGLEAAARGYVVICYGSSLEQQFPTLRSQHEHGRRE